jgi:glycosyltransferase involved in cell wall biosynthesis
MDDLKEIFVRGNGCWRYDFFPRPSGFACDYRHHAKIALKLVRVGAHLYHCLHTFVPVVAPCPVVVTIQDVMFELFPEYEAAIRSRPYRIFRWGARRRARRIICPSRTTAADLQRLWGVAPSRLDVIYHGLGAFDPHGDAEPASTHPVLHRLGSSPFIASPLNLEPRKNLLTLLEGYAKLPRVSPPMRLVLFGKAGWSEDRERQFTADLHRLGLADSILLPGVLTDDDLWWVYRTAALFVFPSLYEGFGYPVLEAMAAGACTVVRGASAMAEVVGEAGVKLEPLTADALCATMQELLDDEGRRRRLGQAARRRAAEFSSERMARNTFSTYCKALGLPDGRRS